MLKIAAAIALGSLALLALAAPKPPPASAAPASIPFTVNSTLDEVDDNLGDGLCHSASNHCTLRAAVMEADLSSGAGATIILPSGIYSLTIPALGGDDASTGDLNLTTPPLDTDPLIQVVGAGAASTIIDANQLDRVLFIDAGRTAIISGVTLRDGFAQDGGGLYNKGTLTMTNSTISGNQAAGSGASGGGAYNFGTFVLVQSTISGNSATSGGGGIFNFGSMLAERSTISANHAGAGGGVYNFVDSLILVNSTLSQNYAVEDGGGIYNQGQSNIYSTTIVGNWADSDRQGAGSGGGVNNSGTNTFNLLNSLLAGNNLGDAPVWDDCTGTLNAYGTDFVGFENDDQTICTIIQPSGGNLYKLNSLNYLSGLQDNGGPTWTIALRAGSSAITDGGNPVTCTDENSNLLATDQRGVNRVAGGNCDIGAYEFLPPVLYFPLLRR